ncbi:MAG TPA: hypothetical protein VKZ63_05730 [Kofleriaceae bacterium]|nr:hypothetical protein [Kofleriaceae bacterium]
MTGELAPGSAAPGEARRPGARLLLVANLDAEIEMARAATPGPHPDVRPEVARLIARAGSHMAALGRPGDALWLPAAIPQGELAPAARELAIATGPLPPAQAILPWAVTGAVERHGAPVFGGGASAEVARRVNHRGFSFALAEARSWALPGARVVRDVAEIERHLAAGGAAAGGGRWIVKAPYSAAGRERLRQTGASLGRGAAARAERLLARFGELLFEPWVERVADLACTGRAGEGEVVYPPHRLVTDERGVFRAAVIDDAGDPAVPPGEHRAVRQAAEEVAGALAAAGYRGPFGIDAFLWRDPRTGAVRLQRASEINARLTFGLLARAAAERAGVAGGRFELRL